MLKLVIPDAELFNEDTQEFITIKHQVLALEHSLVSVSKWESKWRKSFFKSEKTQEETIDYVRCMTKTQNVNPLIYHNIPQSVLEKIQEYIENPMSATRFSEKDKPGGGETVTSELIYYWMIALNIPFECQKWHLNRLFTLIKICEIKSRGGKKMSVNEIQRQNAELNAARRNKLKSKG